MHIYIIAFSNLASYPILLSSFQFRLITIVKGYNIAFNILWSVYLM